MHACNFPEGCSSHSHVSHSRRVYRFPVWKAEYHAAPFYRSAAARNSPSPSSFRLFISLSIIIRSLIHLLSLSSGLLRLLLFIPVFPSLSNFFPHLPPRSISFHLRSPAPALPFYTSPTTRPSFQPPTTAPGLSDSSHHRARSIGPPPPPALSHCLPAMQHLYLSSFTIALARVLRRTASLLERREYPNARNSGSSFLRRFVKRRRIG